jgi:hypothetical protein
MPRLLVTALPVVDDLQVDDLQVLRIALVNPPRGFVRICEAQACPGCVESTSASSPAGWTAAPSHRSLHRSTPGAAERDVAADGGLAQLSAVLVDQRCQIR